MNASAVRDIENRTGEKLADLSRTSAVFAMVVDLLTLVGVVGLAAVAAAASFVCLRVFSNFCPSKRASPSWGRGSERRANGQCISGECVFLVNVSFW